MLVIDTISYFAAAFTVLLFWKIAKGYILRSPLDAVPGPPSDSLLKGAPKCVESTRLSLIVFALGNFLRAHTRDAWDFMDHLTRDYGQVVRLTGFLGVYILLFPPSGILTYQRLLLSRLDFSGFLIQRLCNMSFSRTRTFTRRLLLLSRTIYSKCIRCELFTMPSTGLVTSHLVQDSCRHLVRRCCARSGSRRGAESVAGDHHRRQRKLLNPVFSIANMRAMTPIFYETVNRVSAALLPVAIG